MLEQVHHWAGFDEVFAEDAEACRRMGSSALTPALSPGRGGAVAAREVLRGALGHPADAKRYLRHVLGQNRDRDVHPRRLRIRAEEFCAFAILENFATEPR